MEISLQRGQHLQTVVHRADLRKWWIISGGVCLYSVPRERAYTHSLDYLIHCWIKWEVNAVTFSSTRSWTHSSQMCTVHKSGQLSVLHVFCPDFRLTMSAVEGQSTWLNIRTVRLLQGCKGDVQLCCSQDRFAPETIQLLLCSDAQFKVRLDWA